MFEEKDDTILARWLARSLTPEEHSEFEQSSEFKDYQEIVKGLNRFEKPDFDKEALRLKIKNQIGESKSKKGKLISLKPFLYIASVAASVILILGFFFNEVKYETGFGQQLAVTLPNGTEIQLNAQSQLIHARFFWKNNKKVNLQGEGYFNVEKGEGFTVATSSGTVSVLGTQFNIKTRANIFELTCYQGKVQFEAITTKEKTILTKGNAIKLIEDVFEKGTIENKSPSWISGRSSFNNVPLSEVLNELQIQYNITIENQGVDVSKRFTGSFTYNKLDITLKIIFVPMGIEYELTNNRKILKLLSVP